MCEAYGARYVDREHHDHAKAGNMNHALAMMAEEEKAGAPAIGIIAALDCDHVPLPTFRTATLGWFEDPDVALVQGPQAFYNAGAFDDDGITGEQGLIFNVQMRARNAAGAGPFWCGSTSLLRVTALRQVGGVATETITEDMHTTLKLIRLGWTTVYHHHTLAVGLAPATPEQYLLQRRRWGMGAMQILTHERLWAAKRWMSWRNFHEYLNGTLWWLEGIATIIAFLVPMLLMISGARTTTAEARRSPLRTHRGAGMLSDSPDARHTESQEPCSLTGRRGRQETEDVSIDEESKAIDDVVDRLAERFPHVPRPSIEQTVREEHQALAEGRIRDYVPVLVEHAARARLSR